MKTRTWRLSASTALVTLLVLEAGPAAGPAVAGEGPVTRLAISPGSRLWLEGTTNVGARWACRSERIEGVMELDAPSSVVVALIQRAIEAEPGELAAAGGELPAPRLRIRVPVTALGCGNPAMESDMRQALRAAEHPTIVYEYERVTGLAPLAGKTSGARRFDIGVEGELALAGSDRTVRTQVVGERLGAGLYQITGEMDLRMTDFGIEPPTALMGLIQARNQLRVRFDLRLRLDDELLRPAGERTRGGSR